MNRIKKAWKQVWDKIKFISLLLFIITISVLIWQLLFSVADTFRKNRAHEKSFKYEVNMENYPRYYTDSYICTNNTISFYDGINSNNITSTRKWTVTQQHE